MNEKEIELIKQILIGIEEIKLGFSYNKSKLQNIDIKIDKIQNTIDGTLNIMSQIENNLKF